MCPRQMSHMKCQALFSLNKMSVTILCATLCLALWVKFSADDIDIFFLFFPENSGHFMQIVSNGDSLHEMSAPVFWEK